VAHRDTVDLLHIKIGADLRTDAPKADQIVHPQGDCDRMFALQLARQSPANADVAIVIDDFAKQGQRTRWCSGGSGGEWHVQVIRVRFRWPALLL